MAKSTPLRQATATAGFIAFAVALILLAILPLDRVPGALPGPDLLLAATLVWVIRRPDVVPLGVVVVVFLLADFLWMRPPGLMTAAVVLGTEFLRSRSVLTTEVSFAAEWSVAAAIAAAIVIGGSAVLVLFGVAAPGLGMLLLKLLGTIAAYPVIVVIARFGFGVRRKGVPARLGFGGRA